MAEKYFKVMIVGFFIFAFVVMFIGISSDNDNYDVTVTQNVAAADGLNLKAVGELLKDAKNAEDFEKLINDKDKGVNNLDLDEDGKVDYIKVTEFGKDDSRGFSLTVDVAPGETQEVATISIDKESDGSARVQTQGNPNIYGANQYYHSTWQPGFGSGLLMGYLFSNHSYYNSPWGYARYPTTYTNYSTVPRSTYSSTMSTKTSQSTFSQGKHAKMLSSIESPNAGKSATSIRAGLASPTASQKSFQARSSSSSVRSGGFGSSSSRSSSVRSSSRSGGSSGGK